MTQYQTNTRMYDATPKVADLWRTLTDSVAKTAKIPLVHKPHPWPADIEALWRRSDLGLVFMCGFPFRLFGAQHKAIAVPILQDAPCAEAAEGSPLPSGSLYTTHFLVRKDCPWTCLEDSFGSKLGLTVAHSHSGYNAVRRALLPHSARGTLYQSYVGPLHTPKRSLDALVQHEADIVPLDSYYYTLLMRHAPEQLQETRVLASAPPAPMPFFVASPETPHSVCDALRAALIAYNDTAVLDELALSGFASVTPEDYLLLDLWNQQAETARLNWLSA